MDEAEFATISLGGQVAFEGCEDRVADGCAVLQDVVIPEAEDGIALLPNEFVSASVMGTVGMLGTVDFDDKPLLSTAEVGEIRLDWMLSYEMVASELTAFQLKP